MPTTSVPFVIDALLDLARALPEFEGVQVCDGFPGATQWPDLFVIGGTNDNTSTGSQRPAAIGRGRRAEDYDVMCALSSWHGGAEQKPTRDRVFVLFEAFAAALAADPTLGGVARYCQVSTLDLEQSDEEDAPHGRTATVYFSVSVANDIYPTR